MSYRRVPLRLRDVIHDGRGNLGQPIKIMRTPQAEDRD
jgi:hypothetical protein